MQIKPLTQLQLSFIHHYIKVKKQKHYMQTNPNITVYNKIKVKQKLTDLENYILTF